MYIEVDTDAKDLTVLATTQWSRTHINTIANDISRFYKQLAWEVLYIDQITGEHLIQDIRLLEVPLKVITLQKELKDPRELNRINVMDIKEHIQFMIQLNTQHKIKFPEDMSEDLRELWEQSKTFREFKTEQGSMDYRAEGEALDDMVRALLIVCFSCRKLIMGADGTHVCGSIQRLPPMEDDLIVIREQELEGLI